VLEVKGEIPFIIIVSVSVAGVLLLLLNIVLVSCFVQRRCSVSSRETTDGRSERVPCVYCTAMPKRVYFIESHPKLTASSNFLLKNVRQLCAF
jgi:hypothetical protein